jgi:YD repeat-containing protein
VKITPLYHASTLIEAGGKTIYLDYRGHSRLQPQTRTGGGKTLSRQGARQRVRAHLWW